MTGILAASAAPYMIAGSVLLAFGAGFVLGIAYGVKEEHENHIARAARRERELRTVRVTIDSNAGRVTQGRPFS